MKTHMKRQNNGNWSVYRGNHLVISEESYQVAANVESALNGQPTGTECDDVAARFLNTTNEE